MSVPVSGEHQPPVFVPVAIRPARVGAYQWTDRDEDVGAALEPRDHPSIVAALSLVTTRDAPQGVVSADIYINREQAHEIIKWLQQTLSTRQEAKDGE